MLDKIWAVLLFMGILVAGLMGRFSGADSITDAAAEKSKSVVMDIARRLLFAFS